ncbi:MAG: DUF1080 domain-containing protein [Bacteroidota bacterium]
MLSYKPIFPFLLRRRTFGWLFGFFIAFTPFGCGEQNTNESNQSSAVSTKPINTLTSQEKTLGWKLLFDGKDLSAWRGYNKSNFPSSGWTIKDGMLMMEATGKEEEGYGGDIITKDQYENFEFRTDFKLSPDANSGILYLVKEIKGEPIWHSAAEFQILDDEGYEMKGKYVMDKHRTGDNFDLQAATENALKPLGEWNEAIVKVNKGKVEHWLNGQRVLEYTLWTPEWKEKVKNSKFAKYPDYGMSKQGHIGIQDWGHKMWYRNIKIKEL